MADRVKNNKAFKIKDNFKMQFLAITKVTSASIFISGQWNVVSNLILSNFLKCFYMLNLYIK